MACILVCFGIHVGQFSSPRNMVGCAPESTSSLLATNPQESVKSSPSPMEAAAEAGKSKLFGEVGD